MDLELRGLEFSPQSPQSQILLLENHRDPSWALTASHSLLTYPPRKEDRKVHLLQIAGFLKHIANIYVVAM